MDKKYQVFGEKNEEEEEVEAKNFLSIIQRTLKEALDGLLTTAEVPKLKPPFFPLLLYACLFFPETGKMILMNI